MVTTALRDQSIKGYLLSKAPFRRKPPSGQSPHRNKMLPNLFFYSDVEDLNLWDDAPPTRASFLKSYTLEQTLVRHRRTNLAE